MTVLCVAFKELYISAGLLRHVGWNCATVTSAAGNVELSGMAQCHLLKDREEVRKSASCEK